MTWFLFSVKPKQKGFSSQIHTNTSKTNEHNINVINSLLVSNTKEKMLKFMILAISNINMHTYFSIRANISREEVNFVRFSQVYEKSQNNAFTKMHFMTLAQKKFKQSNENVSMERHYKRRVNGTNTDSARYHLLNSL